MTVTVDRNNQGHPFVLAGARAALACVGALWLASFTAALAAGSASFQLLSHTNSIGSNQSGSGSFQLQSCVNASPTGSGASGSFRLQSGCITVLQAVNDSLPPITPPPVTPTLQVPVPWGDTWAILLLALVLLMAAERKLRRLDARPG